MSPRRRRPRAEALSPLDPDSALDTYLLLLPAISVLGMVLLFGGTVFWASAPFWILGLLAVAGCQIRALLALRAGGGRLSPPFGTGLWLFLCAVVLVRASWIPRVPFQAWTEFLQLVSGLLFYITFSDLGNRRGLWRGVLGAFLLTACLLSIYALRQHWLGERGVLWLERPESYGMRASGVFICPNHFAHVLQMASLLAVGLLGMPSAGLTLRLFSGYTLLFTLPALVLTLSRAGLLGLVAGLILFFGALALRRGWRGVLVVLAALVPAGGGILLGLWRLVPGFRARVVEQTLRGDVRLSQYWPDTWNLIRGEGFWGAGPGTFRHVFDQYREHFSSSAQYLHYAHSEILHTLAEYGWLTTLVLSAGLMALLGRWFLIGLRAEGGGRRLPFLQMALLGGSLVHAAFDFNLHTPGCAMVLALLIGLLDGRGLQGGLWRRRPLSPALSRFLPWPALAVSLLSALAYVPLFLGSVAEYRLNSALSREEFESARRAAASLRRWTPMLSRGWNELGYERRVAATWLREPKARAQAIAESRKAYARALRWNPLDRIARAGVAELDKLEGDFLAAAEALEELVRLSPFDVRVRIQYGLALSRAGRLREALEVFEQADRMRPGDRQIRLNLESLRRRMERGDAGSEPGHSP